MTAVEDRRDTDAAPADGVQDAADAGASDEARSESGEVESGSADVRPVFRIVAGSPTDEEIAALVAVFSALAAAGGAPAARGPRDEWGQPTAMHRTAQPFSPYSFASSFPR